MMLNIFPIPGLPEIKPGDDLAELIFQSCKNTQIEILDGAELKPYEGMLFGGMYADWKKRKGYD